MKLKNLLLSTFIVLIIVPITGITLLLYKSGFELSQASYNRNLIESITVQEDYISQNIENNMVLDFRFVNRVRPFLEPPRGTPPDKSQLLAAYQTYLESSEDKITVCILLDSQNTPLYTIGEKKVLETVLRQLPDLSTLQGQTTREFELDPSAYSLGIITTVRGDDDTYLGSFISIYSRHYIFKIISSYYNISDSSTYICRGNGGIINYRKLKDDRQNSAIEKALNSLTFTSDGTISQTVDGVPVSGYYKKIAKTPWYLVGFINETQVYTFANQFVWAYIFIIIGVLTLAVLLSFYFSGRVVQPINGLIKVMDSYQIGMPETADPTASQNDYYEIQYLRTKFSDLMRTIMLVQHNFEGIFRLYQSGNMSDTNIDIDVINQTARSNKEVFQTLMNGLELSPEACVVERFTQCFCEKDQALLMGMFEKMRDEHLAIAREAEVCTPYFGQKWFHTLVVPMYVDERLSRLFIQLRDISSFKRQEFESMEQARKDPLTGVYNRAGFTELVTHTLGSSDAQTTHGLLFLDMDYFKLVNDNLGHSTGDTLLRTVGATLIELCGADNIPSRFGGDEFAVFMPCTSPECIELLRQSLTRRLIFPFKTDKFSFVVSASIGTAIWNGTRPCSLEELLQRADVDMYSAKKRLKQNAHHQ